MTIEELNALTTLTQSDKIPAWDNEATSSEEPTKRITALNLALAVKSLAALVDSSSLSSYVPKSDIVNNLTTATTGKPLDAAQGKTLLDTLNERISNYMPPTNYTTLAEAAAAIFNGMSDGTIKFGRFVRNTAFAYFAMRNSANYATMLCFTYGTAKLYIVMKSAGNISTYSITATAE